MSLIDATYFRGEINIAQLSQPAVVENLQYFIDKYESEFLDCLFGLSLSEAFLDGLKEEEPETRWTNIRDGIIFQDGGKDRRWIGFVNDRKLSPIANYVYYHYKADEVSQSVGIATVRPSAENSEVVSPGMKIERAWNEMIDWLCPLYGYLDSNKDIYPEWKARTDCGCGEFRKINRYGL